MSYKSWLSDKSETAAAKLKEAKKAVKLAEFSHKVYDVIFELSMNDKFSYQVANDFCFERVLNSSEFTKEEKEKVQIIADDYKKIAA